MPSPSEPPDPPRRAGGGERPPRPPAPPAAALPREPQPPLEEDETYEPPAEEEPFYDEGSYEYDGLSAAAAFPSRRTLALGFLLAAVLASVALFWTSCENHYRSCLTAVDVRTRGDNSPLGRLARQDGVKSCSRSPFSG